MSSCIFWPNISSWISWLSQNIWFFLHYWYIFLTGFITCTSCTFILPINTLYGHTRIILLLQMSFSVDLNSFWNINCIRARASTTTSVNCQQNHMNERKSINKNVILNNIKLITKPSPTKSPPVGGNQCSCTVIWIERIIHCRHR